MFSLVALIILSPIILITSILIKLDSNGPVFYCQERVSKNDEIFKVLKFRTMVNKAEKESGPTLAEENDTRITRIGRFLRKTRNCHYYCPITCFCPGLSC